MTPAVRELEAAGVAFTMHEYERSESLRDFGLEAAEKLGLDPDQVFKTLLVTADGTQAVAIVPVGHDFPPFSANKGGAGEGTKMFLLTFDLAFELQERIRALEAGGPSADQLARAAERRRPAGPSAS